MQFFTIYARSFFLETNSEQLIDKAEKKFIGCQLSAVSCSELIKNKHLSRSINKYFQKVRHAPVARNETPVARNGLVIARTWRIIARNKFAENTDKHRANTNISRQTANLCYIEGKNSTIRPNKTMLAVYRRADAPTRLFVILETIFAPLQAALPALAIRRKFMR